MLIRSDGLILQNEPNGAGAAAGIEFIDENGGGPGVRLRKSPRVKPSKR
jgi:hypothetical protein